MKALLLLTMVGVVAARSILPCIKGFPLIGIGCIDLDEAKDGGAEDGQSQGAENIPACPPGSIRFGPRCIRQLDDQLKKPCPKGTIFTGTGCAPFDLDEEKEGGAEDGQSQGAENIDQGIQGEAAKQNLGGLGDKAEPIANIEEGPAGKLSPSEDAKEETSPKTVLGRIAERKLQYLVPENEEAILAVTTQPHILAALRAQYDADKDGVISAQEWSDFRPTIAAYIKDVLGFEPVSAEEWDTVIQGDEALDIEGHMFPALFSMTTEPLFDDLAAALYWAFDSDKDGMLSPAEAAEFKAKGPWLDPEAIPAARPFHYQPLLAEIAASQGNEAACTIVARFKDVLKAPLVDHGLQC